MSSSRAKGCLLVLMRPSITPSTRRLSVTQGSKPTCLYIRRTSMRCYESLCSFPIFLLLWHFRPKNALQPLIFFSIWRRQAPNHLSTKPHSMLSSNAACFSPHLSRSTEQPQISKATPKVSSTMVHQVCFLLHKIQSIPGLQSYPNLYLTSQTKSNS